MIQKILFFISKFRLKICFLIIGLSSLTWFLIRIIPKPSRAQYPCMKAAAPLASSFLTYLLGITVFSFVFKKAKQRLFQSKYISAFLFIMVGIVAGSFAILNTDTKAVAYVMSSDQPVNEPIGEGKGVFPGRVVWVQNPKATNENCTNNRGDYWSMDKNTDQDIVNSMVSSSIQQLTSTTSDVAAWDQIFRYYNKNHERGDIGYVRGEKIVIKINLNGQGGEGNINTSPQVCHSILDQLVNVAGVKQSDIGIGDPNGDMKDATYEKCHTSFPDVEYWGYSPGRVQVDPSDEPVLFAGDGSFADRLPQQYIDADYMINIPVLKKHHRAGISIACKNHFGSIGCFTGGAWHLHPSLPCPNATGGDDNGEYGVYRCFVDIMGHKDLGGKTILYLVDGLWGSVNWGHPAVKWAMPPFNGDYPNSLLTSLDPVAIESVCFDFLYYEFDEDHPTEGGEPNGETGPYPHFAGVDDYMHQAADTKNWPVGITYDPENDGSPLKSMGTHEHWNNAIDKQYSRNLSVNGTGIELLRVWPTGNLDLSSGDKVNGVTNFPNPLMGSTTIQFLLEYPSDVQLTVFAFDGKKVGSYAIGRMTNGVQKFELTNANGLPVKAGNYLYTVEANSAKGKTQFSNRMVVLE
jgi:hypothetical protein